MRCFSFGKFNNITMVYECLSFFLFNQLISRNFSHICNLYFFRFSVSLSYYGISYTIPNLSGDRYLNFIIGGGIELAAYMLAFVVLNGFGRKYPLMIYLLLSGLLCISVVSVRTFVPGNHRNYIQKKKKLSSEHEEQPIKICCR